MARNDLKTSGGNSGSQLGFEAEMFKAADKLRGNMEPSDYKHVALGLIFLKYISDAFEARHTALLLDDPQAAEDKDEYLADNVFWVPKDARWSQLQAGAKLPAIGTLVDRTRRELSDADVQKIADTYHAWRGEPQQEDYADIAGYCKSASLEEIRKHGHVLTPGRFVGAQAAEDDGEAFEEKMPRLVAQLQAQFAESATLELAIRANLKGLGYGN